METTIQESLFTSPTSTEKNELHEGFMASDRPLIFESIVGQHKAIKKINPLLQSSSAHFIFYGPPGCGKTTICRAIEKLVDLPVKYYNPVSQTLSELKKINAEMNGQHYVLSVDEIHRMDKKQQEFLLPFLESGSFKLIASTTENPYAFFTRAVISRVTPIKLEALENHDIQHILQAQKKCPENVAKKIAALNLNDARKAILLYEQVKHIEENNLDEALRELTPNTVYDKTRHYDLLSALIKSMRASEVEESNQWLARLLVEGGDLMVICRRLIIFASEDIGDAAPYALMKTVACMQAVEKIGMPEAQIILGDCVSFLSKSPKSRENYDRIKHHMKKAQDGFTRVPEHRRNRKGP